MGGECEVFLNGKTAGKAGPEESVALPPARKDDEIALAIRNAEGWMSHENPCPVSLTCDRQRELMALYEELFFVKGLRKLDSSSEDSVNRCLSSFLGRVDQEALSQGRFEACTASLIAARASLAGAGPLLKRYRVQVVPHSHVDLAWGWTYEETKRIMRTVFDLATRLMDSNQAYTFAQDQPPAYLHLEGSALMEKIAKYVSAGRLDPCGALYSEPEGNMPCGESFIRQVMLSKRYFAEGFGVEPSSGWNLDSFSGHSWSLPQILKRSGVRYYTFANWANLIPDVEYWWEGPDGSRVLAYHLPCHYDSAQMMEHRKILNNFFGYASRSKCRCYMFLDGDDLTPPTRSSIEGVEWFSKLVVGPTVEFSTPARFFQDLEKQNLDGIPTYRGELPQYMDDSGNNNAGSYSTHCEVKRRNRLCENLLLAAEKLGSLAALLGMEYPRESVARAWRHVLLNQMHDILPGTAIKDAYDEAHRRYDEAETLSWEVIRSSMARISSRADTRGAGIPVVVFNTLSWERTDPVEVKLTLEHSYSAWPRMVDSEGRDVECQVLEDTRGTYDKANRNLTVLFVADKVPPLGYEVYHLSLDGHRPTTSLAVEDADQLVLQNEFLEARIDRRDGLLTSLKAAGREFIASRAGLALERCTDEGDPWHLKITGDPVRIDGVESVDLVEKGPIRATVRIRRRDGANAILQEVSLCKGSPRLVCSTTIDIQDMRILYKLVAPAALEAARAAFEIPFASIIREPTIDRPAQNWVDLSDGSFGLALLNAGRYGYDLRDGTRLRVTLVRNPRGHRSREGTDTGRHTTSIALYAHRGDWTSGVVRQGLEFNNPLLCHVDTQHGGRLPGRAFFISISAMNVIASCLKPHEDSDDLILRLYEAHGLDTSDVGLESLIGWETMEESDMTERSSEGRLPEGPLSISHYQIRTLRLRRPRLRAGIGLAGLPGRGAS